VRQLPNRRRFFERPMEGWPNPPQGWIRHDLVVRSPSRRQKPVCLRAHSGHGAVTRLVHAPRGVGPSPQRCEGRQSAGEPGTLDASTASRDPRVRRSPGHAKSLLGIRSTRTPPTMLRVFGERPRGGLPRALGPTLSTLGGGGNRTRVLRYITRASPGAACCGFLVPGGLAGEPPPGSVAVRCPAHPRDRTERWILLADARHRAGGSPGLTTSNSR
jgi:hypothetical protein